MNSESHTRDSDDAPRGEEGETSEFSLAMFKPNGPLLRIGALLARQLRTAANELDPAAGEAPPAGS